MYPLRGGIAAMERHRQALLPALVSFADSLLVNLFQGQYGYSGAQQVRGAVRPARWGFGPGCRQGTGAAA